MLNKSAFRLAKDNRLLAGVCGGLAKYFNIDVTIVRLIAVFLFMISPDHLIVPALYLIAWAVFPEEA